MIAPLTSEEARAASYCISGPNAVSFREMYRDDQAWMRLLAYRRAIRHGMFTDYHADDRPCACYGCMHRGSRP